MKQLLYSVFLLIALISCDSSDSKYRSIDLKATIEKSSLQLVVTNHDSFNWKNVKIEINNEYVYSIPEFPSGEKVSIGFLNFANSKYEKLNPFVIKIAEVTISATTDTGGIGFTSGSFN